MSCTQLPDHGDDVDSDNEARVRALVRLSKDLIGENVLPTSLDSITKLDLSGCNLSEKDICDYFPNYLSNLSILFLSDNRFQQLPPVIGKFPKLQMIAFKGNNMTSIHPEALQPQLRWLILTDNKIQQIPDTIGRCQKLQKCMLSGNLIQELPMSMMNCCNLELIRIASNCLTEPPLHILQLPQLKWIALADNPFVNHIALPPPTLIIPNSKSTQPIRTITDLVNEEAGEILGQGAGGVTRRICYHGQDVAVKTYHGSITSDGLPTTERTIALTVAQLDCPAFIRVLGICHPSGSLVMEYLNGYMALAGPPNMITCSRDVYHPESPHTISFWSRSDVASLVTHLLDALRQLHQHGILHGDLYAHNILIQCTNRRQVRLSDFGAAMFYESNTKYGQLLQYIEVQAFAVLVVEIASLMEPTIDGNNDTLLLLKELVQKCQQPDATFERIYIWWMQQQLATMAVTDFAVNDED